MNETHIKIDFTNNDIFFEDIKEIIPQGKNKAKQIIDIAMVQTYWKIGYRIVENEQSGEIRVEYG